jgi:hypothetical protein
MHKSWRVTSIAVACVLAVTACGKSPSLSAVRNGAPTTSSSEATSTTAASNSPAAISLGIASPTDGTTIKGNVVKLFMNVSGISIVKPDGDTSGKTGHFHVFIDRDPLPVGAVIPKEKGIVHSETNPIVVAGLTLGAHHLTVVIGDGTHRRISDAQATVTVNVSGPAIQASAPATVPVGQPVHVTVMVQGVTLAEPNGDTSGSTGHLHFFVDREPTPAGQPIPKGDPTIIHSAKPEVDLPGLAAGAHTVWVVLGDGNHVPFDPPVEAKVTFTVGP